MLAKVEEMLMGVVLLDLLPELWNISVQETVLSLFTLATLRSMCILMLTRWEFTQFREKSYLEKTTHR